MQDFIIQGDVFCFTKLEEALIEVNFVIEAVHEDLEDKKSLLESKTIITQQFLGTLHAIRSYKHQCQFGCGNLKMVGPKQQDF